jgi:hypothetical protein
MSPARSTPTGRQAPIPLAISYVTPLDIEDNAVIGSEAAGHFEGIDKIVLTPYGKRRGSCITGPDLDVQIQPACTVLGKLDETVAHHPPPKDKTRRRDHAADIPLVLSLPSLRIKNVHFA